MCVRVCMCVFFHNNLAGNNKLTNVKNSDFNFELVSEILPVFYQAADHLSPSSRTGSPPPHRKDPSGNLQASWNMSKYSIVNGRESWKMSRRWQTSDLSRQLLRDFFLWDDVCSVLGFERVAKNHKAGNGFMMEEVWRGLKESWERQRMPQPFKEAERREIWWNY